MKLRRILVLLLCALAEFVFVETQGLIDTGNSSDAVCNAIVGAQFNLKCIPTATAVHQNVTIAWYFNNVPLCLQEELQPSSSSACLQGDNLTTSDASGILVFSLLSLDQAGWYTCAVDGRVMGREDRDFLLIVQEAPTINTMTFVDQLDYVTVEGYRVELPCSVTGGLPYPNITWQADGEDLSLLQPPYMYIEDSSTGSLIIHGIQRPEDVEHVAFGCVASNSVGSARSANFSLTINRTNDFPFTSPFSSLVENQSALYRMENDTGSIPLTCTNLTGSELASYNLTIRWWTDSSFMPSNNNEISPNLRSNSSGYYCCQVQNVTALVETVLTVCASLVILGTPDSASLPPTITLPAAKNRIANFLCQAPPSAGNTKTPFDFSWENSRGEPLMAGGELGLELSNASQGLQSYLQATSLISAISENFSCTASTSAGGLQLTKSTTFRITVVDVCDTDNVLAPEIDAWHGTGGAEFREVNSEEVFVIEGNASLKQQVTVTGSVFLISGRVRQTANGGQAAIRLLLNDLEYMVLTSPEPASLMWQWISVRGEFNSALPLDTLTVELALGGENTTTTVAYFDDLCLRFSQPFLVSPAIIAAASLGAFVLLLFILLLLLVSRCCCCQRKNSHGQKAVLMSKVTTTLRKKWKSRRDQTLRVQHRQKKGSTNSELNGQQSTSKNFATDSENITVDAQASATTRQESNHHSKAEDYYYVNEGLVMARHSGLVPSPSPLDLNSSPTVPVVISTSHSNASHKSPNQDIDFGEGDFTFIDPNSLAASTSRPTRIRSNSANTTTQALKPSKEQTQTLSRSTENVRASEEVYSYVSRDVEWALNKSRTASYQSSLTDEEDTVEQPIYQNELVHVQMDVLSTDEPIYY